MPAPVIIGLAMIVVGLSLAAWIAYTVVHQRREERRRSED
jgi:xanthine/uracil permease